MKTPEFNAQNYKAVYDHLSNQKMHKVLPIITFLIDNLTYHPSVEVDDETIDFVKRSSKTKTPIIIISNHLQYHDHDVINAAIRHVPKLSRRLVGNTIAWSKEPHFQEPGIKGKTKKFIYLNQNVKPVSRSVDIRNELGYDDDILAGRAGSYLIKTTVKGMEKGSSVALWPEGTRNQINWDEVQQFESGVGHLAINAWKINDQIPIIPFGIAYKDNSEDSLKHASVNIGEPIYYRKDNARRIAVVSQFAVQECVNAAISNLAA